MKFRHEKQQYATVALLKAETSVVNRKNDESYIVENKKYSTIAIVTHGGVIRFIVREILNKGELKSLGDCEVLFIQKNKKRYQLTIMKNAQN